MNCKDDFIEESRVDFNSIDISHNEYKSHYKSENEQTYGKLETK